jgi:hypothetical protein
MTASCCNQIVRSLRQLAQARPGGRLKGRELAPGPWARESRP